MTRRRPEPETTFLDFRLGTGDHATVADIAKATGYAPETILAAIDDGRLGAFTLRGRGRGERLHARVPMPLARLFLIQNSSGLSDELIVDQFSKAGAAVPRDLLAQVYTEYARQLRNPKHK